MRRLAFSVAVLAFAPIGAVSAQDTATNGIVVQVTNPVERRARLAAPPATTVIAPDPSSPGLVVQGEPNAAYSVTVATAESRATVPAAFDEDGESRISTPTSAAVVIDNP